MSTVLRPAASTWNCTGRVFPFSAPGGLSGGMTILLATGLLTFTNGSPEVTRAINESQTGPLRVTGGCRFDAEPGGKPHAYRGSPHATSPTIRIIGLPGESLVGSYAAIVCNTHHSLRTIVKEPGRAAGRTTHPAFSVACHPSPCGVVSWSGPVMGTDNVVPSAARKTPSLAVRWPH